MKKAPAMNISDAAAALGKVGGASTSNAKAEAARRNGRKGGRPAKYPKKANKTGY